MKALFAFFAACFLCATAVCQDAPNEITIRSNFWGMQFYQNNKRLSTRELVKAMEPNAEAYKQIKSANGKNTLAGILSTAGGFMIGWPIGTSMGGGQPQWALAGVGAGLVAVGIPLSISANKKTKSAVALYNEGLKSTVSTNELRFNFKGNSLGLVFSF